MTVVVAVNEPREEEEEIVLVGGEEWEQYCGRELGWVVGTSQVLSACYDMLNLRTAGCVVFCLARLVTSTRILYIRCISSRWRMRSVPHNSENSQLQNCASTRTRAREDLCCFVTVFIYRESARS